MNKKGLFLFLLSHCFLFLNAQESFFSRIEILTDTARYDNYHNLVKVNGVKRLCFYYNKPDQIAEVRLFPKNKKLNLDVFSTKDYEIVDSVLKIGNYYRFKVAFSNLNRSELLRFTLSVEVDSMISFEEILLQPLTRTSASLMITDNELYVGEEKSFEIFSDNKENLNLSSEWKSTENFDYRYTHEGEKVFLKIVPQQTGRQELNAKINAKKPWMDTHKNLIYSIPDLNAVFNVTASRLQFLRLDQTEVTYCQEARDEGIEVQLDYNRMLKMNTTYRVEAQEEPGGALVAEIFTKQRLGNNRVLCLLRPYNIHRSSNGYLYIKEGDSPRFISNFSITPETHIDKILVLKGGNEWVPSTILSPGETYTVRLVGEGMHKAAFYFEDLLVVNKDSLINSETQQTFKLQVPLNIDKKSVSIFNHGKPTGKSFNIKEFQRPREFDFVYLDYGERARKLSSIKEPILYEGILKDVVFSFNRSGIDDDVLYGKQYFDIDVRISDRNDKLVELKSIENIAVCPSGKSSRADYYDEKDCLQGNLSLNKYIRKELSDLDGWSKVDMQISQPQDKYQDKVYSQDVELILKRRTSFDVEVSFPAGLVTISKTNDTVDFATLSGISLAVIGQFSFYHPEKINSYRPYKIGAGFLALNAFDFADDSDDRDVGFVVLGSIYPTRKDKKLSFPLYVGGGYFIKDQKFFFLIGPGIKVTL